MGLPHSFEFFEESGRWPEAFALRIHEGVGGVAGGEQVVVAADFVVEVKTGAWFLGHAEVDLQTVVKASGHAVFGVGG